MSELAIITKSQLDAAFRVGASMAKSEGQLDDFLKSFADAKGGFAHITKANHDMVRERAESGYACQKFNLPAKQAAEARLKLKEDATLYGNFRQAWSRGAKRTGFPVFGKNAGNSNAKGNVKPAGSKAKGDKGKNAAPTTSPEAAKNAVATTVANVVKNVGDVTKLDHVFRQTAQTLRAVCIKRAKMTGVAQYAALAEEFYAKVMALEVPKV